MSIANILIRKLLYLILNTFIVHYLLKLGSDDYIIMIMINQKIAITIPTNYSVLYYIVYTMSKKFNNLLH